LHGVIMAGGQGSRLRPLTLTRPKPMVEVLGRPVIDFVKDAMVDAGVEHLVVTTGYKGEQLSAHIEQWSTDPSISARINQEAVPMGTAGSVRLLLDELTETFVVGSGDAVASFDIQALIEAHRSHGAKVTMALWEVEDPTEFGIVGLSETHHGELDGDEPEVLALVPEGEKFDFSKQLFPMVLDMGWPMYAQTINGVWFDVGHPFELIRAQHALIAGRDQLPFPIPQGTFSENDSYFASGVPPQSGIVGSVISTRTTISPSARIENSLIMAGCSIGDNVVIRDSVLGRNVTVQDRTHVERSVIGDEVDIAAGSALMDTRIPEHA